MRVVITGAAGYLGSALVLRLISWLRPGDSIVGVDLQAGPLICFAPCSAFEFVRADAGDLGVLAPYLRSADALVPLAALVGASACVKRPDEAMRVNQEAVERLLADFRGRVVFPTTDAGYPPTTAAAEDYPFYPRSLYAQTKAAAAKAVLARGNAVVYRLASVFGPSASMRNDLLLHHLVQQAVWARSCILTGLKVRRSFVHIDDVVRAFSAALYEEILPGLYNLSNEEKLTKEVVGQQVVAQCPGYGFTPELNADGGVRDPDSRDFWQDPTKLERQGFVASKTVACGIRELVRYYSWRR